MIKIDYDYKYMMNDDNSMLFALVLSPHIKMRWVNEVSILNIYKCLKTYKYVIHPWILFSIKKIWNCYFIFCIVYTYVNHCILVGQCMFNTEQLITIINNPTVINFIELLQIIHSNCQKLCMARNVKLILISGHINSE